ncbi:asparagine synthase (glutamine-hydrolyzing) [Nonlabens marinus]|uniref:asparagine synthase (glutamine-hydrolyzing) n=1 Tax=Nonlabens marinus S1-08 TaxID=1454201 RepID=W8VR22_9FLAO|nr:asparagine synthase (glutamine-hydrolyzing) [Nonlabens marinus]BAO55400.1 asparagine synthetase [Nonlabens marinus S1-08]
MCGVSGIWNRRGPHLNKQQIELFTDSIAHRGPDGSGYYFNEVKGVALGHRRLSILDESNAGKQPMSIDNNLWITYNGEIFNFIELRKELEQLGFRFKSETDTEVFLTAYKAWGLDCFSKFNGMWAAGIYDQSKQELLLVRDRYGIKPLYYLNSKNNLFAFSSETIAFKSLEGFERSFNQNNLNLVFQDAKCLEGRGETIFEHLRQVKPGHFLKVTQSDLIENRWWYPESQSPKVPGTYEEQVEYFKEIFEDACALRLRSDVPLASALSGGLDSSSVYATLHKINRHHSFERRPSNWQNAYTLIFPGSAQDEQYYAEKVAAHVGGNLKTIEVDYSRVDNILSQTRLFDSVYDNPNFILVSLYEKMRTDGIKVSLDGHGVDELLFGYPEMLRQASRSLEGTNNDLQKQLDKIVDSMLFRNGQKKAFTNYLRQQVNRVKILTKNILFENQSSKSDSFVFPDAGKKNIREFDSLSDITNYHFYETSLPSILRNFDRASMQAGVEVRMPFMDYRIVDFLHAIPFESKVKFPFSKRILRSAMKGTLPEEIRVRKSKIGLVAPMDHLLNNYLQEFAMDIMNSKDFIESPYWDGKSIQEYATHKTGKNSWTMQDGMQIWPYLNAYLIK